MKHNKKKILFIVILVIILVVILLFPYFINRNIETYVNDTYDVLIISAGGGGTTYFMDYLLKNTNLKINNKDDKDRIKHISFNRKNELNNVNCDKIIYLYNDPLLAVKSHFRRNWAFDQIKKLGNPHNIKEEELNTMGSFFKKVKDKKKDLYGIKEQYDFYMNNKINKKILFINFNNIIKNKKRIAEFMEVDESVFDNFEIKSRKSNINEDDKVIGKIYKNLFDKINVMDNSIL